MSNVMVGQTLVPFKTEIFQVFTDALKEGWGAHMNEDGIWDVASIMKVPPSKLARIGRQAIRQLSCACRPSMKT